MISVFSLFVDLHAGQRSVTVIVNYLPPPHVPPAIPAAPTPSNRTGPHQPHGNGHARCRERGRTEREVLARELEKSYLVCANPIRKRAADNVVNDHALPVIDLIGAKIGLEALEGGLDFFRITSQEVPLSKSWTIGPHEHPAHVSCCIIHEQSDRIFAPWIACLPMGKVDLKL